MSEDSLGMRLRFLVEQVHEGSVNAAARDLGVAQQTLGRIIDGTVENPRSRLLQKVASFYGVSLDWLVTGSGPTPEFDPAKPISDMARWRVLVDTLQPSDALREALEGLPLSILTASVIIEAGLVPVGRSRETDESRRIASGLEYEAWITLLTRWIKMGGVRKVAAELEKYRTELEVGFSPRALRSQEVRRRRRRKTASTRRR